ncbi:heparinase II/III family protein [Reyranella sp.]|uniref:heparinase II/III family protein n=1 Tax=Reyranella sp. TaxID=1929291 RepID=UPI003BAB42B5
MTLVASDVRRSGEPLVAGARPPRSAPSRPAAARRGASRPAGGWLLGSGLYSMTLGYGSPRSFFAVAPDSWPGDTAIGQRLILGEYLARGIAGAVMPESDDPPWRREGAPVLWLEALNGFSWLRDLRDCGDPSAALLAARLVDDWSNREWRWSPLAWRRDVLAERIVSWIRHYDWLATAADPGFGSRFVFALARQRAHLRRTLRGGLVGHEAVAAFKALIFADLAFLRDGKRFEKSLDQTLSRLARFVKRYVLHDGVVAERAPHLQLAVLRHLIDVRTALASAERRAPAELVAAIDRMAPLLRFFRHGDGGLALFNGAWEGDRTLVDLVLARSGSGDGPPMMALVSGFQRLSAGTSLVIADAGSPPGRGMDGIAHAGTLSFEMSAAHERLIVNCGTHPGAPREWRHFMRYSAAHSTAIVDDTNSTEITDHGSLEYRAGNVVVDRADSDGAQWLDMMHDGYRSLYGIIHRRRLWLSPDGGDLRGEDTFAGYEGRAVTVPDRRFIVRFHLHPSVKATLAQSGQAVLMRLPSGRGWRLRASGAGIGLAESIYLGEEGRVRRTEQIVLVGQVPAEGTTVKWALTRMEG